MASSGPEVVTSELGPTCGQQLHQGWAGTVQTQGSSRGRPAVSHAVEVGGRGGRAGRLGGSAFWASPLGAGCRLPPLSPVLIQLLGVGPQNAREPSERDR